MGTKNVSTQTNAFAPAGMQAYNSLMPQMQGVLSNFMQNPMQAGYLNMLLQQGIHGAQQQGNVQQQNLMQNLAAGGFGGQNLSPFLQSQTAKIGRATSGMKAQDYMNTLLQGANLRMQAAGQAGGYRPLQTGSQTTQQVSGLGTWLPTLLGAGLNFATGGGLGMLGGLFGGGGGGGIYQGMPYGAYSSGPGLGSLPAEWGGINPGTVPSASNALNAAGISGPGMLPPPPMH